MILFVYTNLVSKEKRFKFRRSLFGCQQIFSYVRRLRRSSRTSSSTLVGWVLSVTPCWQAATTPCCLPGHLRKEVIEPGDVFLWEQLLVVTGSLE